MEKTKTNIVGKLVQAVLWLLGVAVALGGIGLTAAAGLDAQQALTGEEGYGRMTQGEMVAYGIGTAGAALFLLAMTVTTLVGLVSFWRYLKREEMV